MTLESYFTRDKNETPVQRNWRNFQECEGLQGLGVDLGKVIFTANTSLYEANFPDEANTLPHMEKSADSNTTLVYTVEDGKLMKRRINKHYDLLNVKEIKSNPVLYSIADRLLIELVPIALGSTIPLVYSMNPEQYKGDPIGYLVAGIGIAGILRVAFSFAPNCDEEMKADRTAWKLYKDHLKNRV